MIKKIYLPVFSIILLTNCEINNDDSEPKKSFNFVAKGNEFVKANNAFAFDVFKNVLSKEDKENVMISPVSLSLALGMVYNGAENETKTAFEKTLKYTSFSRDEINTVNKEIITYITNNISGSLLEIANSIWVKNMFPIKDGFINTNKKYYNAETENLDFSDQNSVDIVNNWVSENTYQKIPKIIESISDNELMFLINTLYFKSDWKYNFDKKITSEMPFYGDKKTEKVKTMQLINNLGFYQNEVFSSVKLPYKDDKYDLSVMLPNKDKEISDVLAILNINKWSNWNKNYIEKSIHLFIPKIKFSYEKKLNDPLSDLGLEVAFSKNADFNSISNTPVSISYVLQKTFIDVEEKGTVAAAVTAVGIQTTSINPPNKTLSLNKPFLFTIIEKETGSICFIGKIGMQKYDE